MMNGITSLDKYFGRVRQFCYTEEDGSAYLEKERVTVNNSTPSAYIRFDGAPSVTRLDNSGTATVSAPLAFIGAYPKGNPDLVRSAVMGALSSCGLSVREWTLDKMLIGTDENIDVSKFTNVALVRVLFTYEYVETNDPKCIIDLCGC